MSFPQEEQQRQRKYLVKTLVASMPDKRQWKQYDQGKKIGMEAGRLMLDQVTEDIGSEWRNPDFTLGILVSYCWVCTRKATQYDWIISDLGGAKVGSKCQLKGKNGKI